MSWSSLDIFIVATNLNTKVSNCLDSNVFGSEGDGRAIFNGKKCSFSKFRIRTINC